MVAVTLSLFSFRLGGDSSGMDGFDFLTINTLRRKNGTTKSASNSLLSFRWRRLGDKMNWRGEVLFFPFGVVRSV